MLATAERTALGFKAMANDQLILTERCVIERCRTEKKNPKLVRIGVGMSIVMPSNLFFCCFAQYIDFDLKGQIDIF